MIKPAAETEPEVDSGTVPPSGNTTPDAAHASTRGFGSTPELPAGFPTIPGYVLQLQIGAGGMGVVYRALQLSLGRTVALKVIRSRELANPQDLKRFVIEAEVVAKLAHPNIVQVYDVGVAEAGPYYTMELLSGANLDETLAKGPMEPRPAAKLLGTVARAVHHAHSHGIVHRDLKPANILLTDDGTPKLVDFGIAKQLAAGEGFTETGKPMGTPGYMAPEQAAGKKEIGPAADVYALGVILYKFLSGRVPFEGDNLYDILHAIITTDPVSPAYFRPEIPRDLEAICLKCLAKKPADRYPSAAALAGDLDRYLNYERISVGWTPPWTRAFKWCRRHPTTTTAVTAMLAILAFSFLFAFLYDRRQAKVEPTTPAIEDPAVKLRREEVQRRVESLLRNQPMPDTVSPHPITNFAELKQPNYSAYEVLSDDRTIDLRSWRKVSPGDSTRSNVLYINRRVVNKIAPTEIYTTEYRTTGRDLILRAITQNPEKSRVLASDQPTTTGGQLMKTRHVVMDVAEIPLHREFTVQNMATMVDSIQVPEDQWLGLIGFKDSLRSSMLILFPKDKPFLEYKLLVAPSRNEKPFPFTDPAIVFQGDNKEWLYWEVSGPKEGFVYRVDWTW